jgi:hypothetical protein
MNKFVNNKNLLIYSLLILLFVLISITVKLNNSYSFNNQNNNPIKRKVVIEPPSSSYTCPQSGYIDCMPTVGPDNRSYKCTKEAISWYTENCPNFQGVAY